MSTGLRIGVLGPMTATVDGRKVALGGPRQRAVLAVLMAARGHLVTQDALIAQAWDERRAPSPATLHSYVAALRKALEPGREAGQTAGVLVREHIGYALRISQDAVDAERFTVLAARGEELLRGGDAERAATVLGEALALWRGPAYAEFERHAFALVATRTARGRPARRLRHDGSSTGAERKHAAKSRGSGWN